jgi:hypothetical protein
MMVNNATVCVESAEEALVAKKSWTAYVGITFLGLFLLLVVVRAIWSFSTIAGLVSFVAATSYIAYRVLTLRSVRLYCDEEGVWIYSGVLPWEKGFNGVKWRDLDDAVYFTGMFSWLFKSYTVRLGHRFTKSSEIILSHIENGNQITAEINSRHQNRVRNQPLS